ncbi:hypothetical protein [Tuwongella immobilis]|uniref:Uncharacterized protein n=1 Tax=Tuwongella immobilis TaxID=692036 RepID=A0A6C2YW69_9BACT|nr:hypothetical protein [Tuwongella immobilis]VIP05125.1 unnamed protein product [Tuwongella immobilis]VTS07606.1 unnamed protein product [Tuwongella immobilis]
MHKHFWRGAALAGGAALVAWLNWPGEPTATPHLVGSAEPASLSVAWNMKSTTIELVPPETTASPAPKKLDLQPEFVEVIDLSRVMESPATRSAESESASVAAFESARDIAGSQAMPLPMAMPYLPEDGPADVEVLTVAPREVRSPMSGGVVSLTSLTRPSKLVLVEAISGESPEPPHAGPIAQASFTVPVMKPIVEAHSGQSPEPPMIESADQTIVAPKLLPIIQSADPMIDAPKVLPTIQADDLTKTPNFPPSK